MVKNPPAMQETRVRSLGWADLLEKAMATHSSILAWRIPGTGEPNRLLSMRSQSRTRLRDWDSAWRWDVWKQSVPLLNAAMICTSEDSISNRIIPFTCIVIPFPVLFSCPRCDLHMLLEHRCCCLILMITSCPYIFSPWVVSLACGVYTRCLELPWSGVYLLPQTLVVSSEVFKEEKDKEMIQ